MAETEQPAVRRALIIAIDGPAGAGKSTVARALAAALGYRHIDSGAMYRVVGLAARQAGVDPADSKAMLELVDKLDFALCDERGHTRIVLAGRDVSEAIREPDVGEWASRAAVLGAVRARLVERQRILGEEGSVVMEGRDIGTVVFPNADCKFFLTASHDQRARRRQGDLKAAGTAASLKTTQDEIEKRDRRDRERACAPLRPAADAVVIDTTALTPSEVVARMLEIVTSRARP